MTADQIVEKHLTALGGREALSKITSRRATGTVSVATPAGPLGGPLEIVRLFEDGRWDVAVLGMNLDAGERPQIVIPAGTWFGTELREGASHCLAGCTVAPGFDFADFELAEGPELEARYPAAADRIRRMSRP